MAQDLHRPRRGQRLHERRVAAPRRFPRRRDDPNGQPAAAVYTLRDGAYRAHSLHVLAGSGAVRELVLYAPPLAAALFPAFGLEVVL